MTKKFANMDEDTRVYDHAGRTVTRRIIIPFNFTNRRLKRNYFVPRFKGTVKGEIVEWVNLDITRHQLIFYDVSRVDSKVLFKSKIIEPKRSAGIEFDYNFPRIDYHCIFHNNELGTIVIYREPEENMSNTDHLRYLSKIFGIKPPPILSHLGSE